MSSRRFAPAFLTICLLGFALLGACASSTGSPGRLPSSRAEDPLPAWSPTEEKRAILDFVARVTLPGGPDYLPPEHRLATFDFDGTIGCEKPDYMEVVVAMNRLCERTKDNPELLEEPLFRAACDGDRETIDQQVEEALLQAFLGEAQGAYVDYVENFVSTHLHPRFQRPYAELYYLPMLQLIDLLRAHEFTVYLVSGSQQGFTRGYGSHVLGLPPAHTIGHVVELELSFADGEASLLRQDSFVPPSIDGAGKVEAIRNRIGLQPVLAFGNSMGDFEMLRFVTTGERPGLGLILVHDDPDEYVYENQELIQNAETYGWQIVRMKDAFEVIFPD